MLGSTQFWNGIRPRATSATAPTSAWHAGGTPIVATQDFHGEFRECEFTLEELEALEKTLKAISIPLGSSVCALDGGSGLIRVYHGHEGWIDFFYRNIEQPQWDPLLAFIHETTERFPPSPPEVMQGNFFDDPPPEDAQPRTRRQNDDHRFWSLSSS